MPAFMSLAVTARLSPRLVSHNARGFLLWRPQQLLLSRHATQTHYVTLRPSSMSAIVRGLRRSLRDPKGRRPPGYNPEVAAHVAKRRQEREAAAKPAYRLFRGKKEITPPPVPKAKTRRARFFDPEDEYGKKSLVYQAKTGALQAEVDALAKQRERARGDEQEERRWTGERSLRRDGGGGRNGRGVRNARSPSGSSFGRRDGARSAQDGLRRSSRRCDGAGYKGRDQDPTRRPFSRDKAFDARLDSRREVRYGRDQRQEFEERDEDRASRSDRYSSQTEAPTSSPVPSSIPYTTAASQFLYGRSVVEAALRSGRRQLYRLYVYGGSNHSGAPQDQQTSEMIQRLAKRRGIAVQIVDERWQRLLDKMSKGRPHNGYVLEASPLPQPPLTALGPYKNKANTDPSQIATGPGFSVELGYQSREEAAVNGTSRFVPVDASTATHHRPLVLLLDQVLDPGNLGAILRSASFLGVTAVVVSRHSSATLTSVALKASAGAAEAMALFSVETPSTFLAQSRKAGWKVYTAVPLPAGGGRRKSILDLDGIEANDPLSNDAIILVMGSEGEGLSRVIRREADVEVSIANRSGSNVVDSLNVSVATGLLCASFLKGTARAGVASKAVDADKTTGASYEEMEEEKPENAKVRDELSIF